MDRKKFTKSATQRAEANLAAGERTLARRARFVRRPPPEDRKRPSGGGEGGEAVPAVPPNKPKPIIGGAEAPVE